MKTIFIKSADFCFHPALPDEITINNVFLTTMNQYMDASLQAITYQIENYLKNEWELPIGQILNVDAFSKKNQHIVEYAGINLIAHSLHSNPRVISTYEDMSPDPLFLSPELVLYPLTKRGIRFKHPKTMSYSEFLRQWQEEEIKFVE